MFAQYDTATGTIVATLSVPVDDAALAAIGRAQIEVPPEVNGLTHRVDLEADLPIAVAILLPEDR